MATWISKPWIEQALMVRKGEHLPKIARAQILKLEEASTNTIWTGVISDKKLFVKALFSELAVKQFKRDNPGLSMGDIQGGLIFVKKYFSACIEGRMGCLEFMLNIDQFKFAGGEGNTQFGGDIIDSSTYPPLQHRLQELHRQSQLMSLADKKESGIDPHTSGLLEIENILLEDHESVFIPQAMKSLLDDIPEWKSSHCPPQATKGVQSQTSSFESLASKEGQQVSAIGLDKSREGQNDDGLESEGLSKKGLYMSPSIRAGKETLKKEASAECSPCVTSTNVLAVYSPSKRKELEAGVGEEKDLTETEKSVQFSADSASQVAVLKAFGQFQCLENGIKQERRENYLLDLPGKQDESDVIMISSSYVSSSQMSVVEPQPLVGLHLITEQKLSPMKPDSDESYSVFQERPGRIKSVDVSIVQSSEKSEETEYALPCITPRKTGTRLNCSLTESQMENLLDASISYDDITSHNFVESSTSAGFNKLSTQEEKDPPNSIPFYFENMTTRYGLSGIELLSQRDQEENVSVFGKIQQSSEDHHQDTSRTFQTKPSDANGLFSGNKSIVLRANAKTCSPDYLERHQTIKRKRSDVDYLTDPALFPPDPTSTSENVDSNSGISLNQLCHHALGVHLAKPVELYSQQDPLILDTSTDSTGPDDVMHNEGGLQLSCDDSMDEERSPSLLQSSLGEPCTLTTPTFDSLPSFQVPVVNPAFLDGTPLPRNEEHHLEPPLSTCLGHRTVIHQRSGTTKKKRKPPPMRFNWFSDAY
ncbi:uncharacterized protein [Montipora foliosa]|uniref:uncharacterized protein isoform X2 n=1 Tax=Montipora foliosa TaxID=591990 RepID=UPI0035F12BE6